MTKSVERFEAKVEKAFDSIMLLNFKRTDRMFAYLLTGQWITGILIALVISPYTWRGELSATHAHIYAAIFLGGAISSLPIILTLTKPGSPITRNTVAVAQMLWSGLLIHLTGGRIETHFHIFGSLAFLSFYRDPLVLIPAIAVIITDHFVRGILWPESIYGMVNPEWWRFLEHTFWVAFESIFLILSIRASRREVHSIAKRQVDLETVNSTVESLVEKRTQELKSSHEQYRTLLETTLAISFEMDVSSLRFTYVGPEAEAILGYPVDAWLRNQFLEDHLHPDDKPAIHTFHSFCAEGKTDTEFRLLSKDGRWLWMRSVMRAVENSSSHKMLRGIILDVTANRRLESELAQAQTRKLESVGRLAAGIAHEINTPVQFVSDSVHFVREGTEGLSTLVLKYKSACEDEKARQAGTFINEIHRIEEDIDLPYLIEKMPKALDRALTGLGQVAAIVRSMKEFAHPDQTEKIAADLNQCVASTLTISRNEYKYVADLETDYGDLPLVSCHVGEINQAVLNIVVNAAHAIADRVAGTGHRGQIRVRTSREGDWAVIAVSDTGGGIPESIREKLFDPFFTTKKVSRGTGQGLAISRSIVVDTHGGSLDFDSVEGEGTTFYIRLPLDSSLDHRSRDEAYSVR